MNDEFWEVNRSAYAVVALTPDYHGTVTVWNTIEEANKDLEERVSYYLSDDCRLYAVEVDDGYEIRNIHDDKLIKCYKVFEEQELI